MYGLVGRTPIDASLPLSFDFVDTALSNTSGLNTRILVDMQKFLACSTVLRHPSFDNQAKQALKIIASATTAFSARTGLVFKSNEFLRWGGN